MDFDLENPFTNFDISSSSFCSDVTSLFRVESDHMLSETYVKSLRVGDFDFIIRKGTVSSISQLCCRFDPFSLYLAVNYLDRFLSSQRLQKPKPWVLHLLATSCVSLAAKMQKTESCMPCLQLEEGFIFDAQTIQRMEMLILGALKWRMRSITPFSFLPFFLSLFKLEEDPESRQALKARASEIILKAQNDVKLIEFRPSEIAASALLSASHDLLPLLFSSFRRAILDCSLVNKEGVWSCYGAIQETTMEGGYEQVFEVVSSSGTPINVLDLQCSASVSGATTGGTSPASDSVTSERLLKRMRREDLVSNHTVQISQS
ncbi:hypothetical protein SAY87_017577 [Trapa incisa]|uniref:Uncharacterized protein n=1 Tax=Trapa incisa TaxID=236973 RepID=A0AAN7L2N6_9MYRT|nr:hypothetical protein SAY87_017577 [Trapa incisa]